MAEPPAKRARRTDSAAMWDANEENGTKDSPRPTDSTRDKDLKKGSQRDEVRNTDRKARRDDEPRRRSRSPDRRERRREHSKDRSYRDRDRDYDRHERDGGRNGGSGGRDRRDRERSRSRDRHDKADHVSSRPERTRHRSRSHSPVRNGGNTPTRTRSPPRGPRTDHDRSRDKVKQEPRAEETKPKPEAKSESKTTLKAEKMEVDEDEDDTDVLIRRKMGFSTFKTTQNTKVPGNQIYAVRKEKKTEYRQYMNRVGGFNRPLSPSR